MNQGLAIFKKMQRFQRGTEEVSDPEEQIRALISLYDEAITQQKFEDAVGKRMLEIPPILKKLPGQYQDYYPTKHDEVPIKRERGRRYFDPQSLGEYPIMAQQGENDVRYTPVTPTKEYPYTTDYEFIHRKIPEQGHDADLAHLSPEEQVQEQIDWEKNIKELLTITPDLTPEERQQVLTLNPKDWDDSTTKKVHAAATYAKGTSNVMNNPGLIFYRKQLRKPKL